jgi:hypothetical protein
VGLNALAAINSSYFFLGRLETGVAGWLMMNTCAPSIALFVAGFVARSRVTLVASAVLMARYGTAGLFVFGWDGPNLFAQIGHLLMTAAVIYVLVKVLRKNSRPVCSLLVGVGVGVAILVPLTLIQTAWFAAHPGLLEQLFSGSLGG